MFHISKNGVYYFFGAGNFGFMFDMCPPSVFGAGLVTEGLILHYDISVSASYGGSGITVTDLKGNSNASLVNAPTYFESNDGILVFNGVNEGLYTNTALDSKFAGTSPTKSEITSLFLWVKPMSQGNILVERGSATINDDIWFESNIDITAAGQFRFTAWNGGGGGWPAGAVYASSSQTLNEWYYAGWTYNGSSLTGYVNGTNVGTVTFNRLAPYNNGHNLHYSIASQTATNTGVNSFCSMSLGAFQVYNKALSSAEVLQNYNAAKSRFGL